jgi:membrane-bound lytic murein transglycosylase D
LVRPTETEFVLRQAENYFTNGKRAFQEGRHVDARRDFDRAIQTLLAAPANLPDRARIEARLDEWTEAIYKYDLDAAASAETSSELPAVSYDRRPLDEILDLTFPVDPTIRGKVRKEILGTGSQLPLEETDSVLSYVNYFSNRGKKTLEIGIKRSGRFKSMIERVLAEEGVPKEMIFLAQAESGFLPRAVSYAAAVGMWQFVQFRGREYGLMQTPGTDDRMDPELATRAAARHLKDLYNHFGDWYLSMAAYNCGPGCVDAAIQRTGYADFWTLQRMGALPQQTANYVPAILGMTIVAKNAEDYGVAVEYDAPLEYDTVVMEYPTHVALAASALDLPISELRELNPALTRLIAPAGYALHMPKGSASRMQAALQLVPGAQRDTWRIHRVEYGDTPASLAKRYGASPAMIASVNGGNLPEAGAFALIPSAYPGDPFRKPAVVAAKKPAAKPVATQQQNKPAQHPVKPAAKPQGPVARSKGTKRRPGA